MTHSGFVPPNPPPVRRARPEVLPEPAVVPAFPQRSHHGAPHAAFIPPQIYPQTWTQPRADPFDSRNQATTRLPVHPTSPLHVQLGRQTFAQAPLQQPNAQQRQHFASLDVPRVSNEVDGWRTDAGATGWGMANSPHGFGATSPREGNRNPGLGIDKNTSLGGGIMNEVDTYATLGSAPIWNTTWRKRVREATKAATASGIWSDDD
jgi:hypothetical protein